MIVTLRLATAADAEFLFRLRTDPETVQASPGPIPTWEQHCVWLNRSLITESRKLYIAQSDHTQIGTGRIDRTEHGVELSLTVAPEHRGKRYAALLIEALCDAAADCWPGSQIFALVQPENGRSLRAFLRVGFIFRTDGLLRLERYDG